MKIGLVGVDILIVGNGKPELLEPLSFQRAKGELEGIRTLSSLLAFLTKGEGVIVMLLHKSKMDAQSMWLDECIFL